MRSRFHFLLATLALTLVPSAFAACNNVEELDNLCLFLKDEQSCYQTFLTDIGMQCTMDKFVGTFDTRDSLGKCTLTDPNVPANIVTQVDFDPPIELTQLPHTSGSVKLTINGTQCGTIEYGENNKLAIAIDAAPALTDPTATCVASDTQFCGSSFSNTPIVTETPNDKETRMTTKCAGGEAFTFDRIEISQHCADRAGYIPQAKLEITPNGVGKEGQVKLSIQYTPEQTLTYLTCTILAQLPPCANGVKDGVETDVDCGGGVCGGCGDQQGCIGATDCTSGVCQVTAGIKKCLGPPPPPP
jgi:hypothetical protein